MTRFKNDPATQKVLANTVRLGPVAADDFDTVFYPGGHGPMWDLVDNETSIALIEAFYNAGKPVAAVCHAPGVFRRVTYQGSSIVKGKRVTGFTNTEEEAVGLTAVVPFLVEDELRRLGGVFEKTDDWLPFVVVDGRLVTGQNPASSTAGATEGLLETDARTREGRLTRRGVRARATGPHVVAACASGLIGTENVKVRPGPSLGLDQRRPPWASMIERLTASPTPIPSGLVV